MASTYLRRQQWWIKFQLPGTKRIIRESLETGDPSRAELLRQKIELEVGLLDPRFQTMSLPERIRAELTPGASVAAAIAAVPPVPVPSPALTAPNPVPAPARARVTIEEAARCYLDYIASENAPETRANKISMLRRFLGPKRAESIVGPSKSTERFGKHRPKIGCGANVAFEGTYLDEVSAAVVQQFIARLGVKKKTQRHYREFFHQFFEVCLNFDLYQPANPYRPNPISALPSYNCKNRRIIYLKTAQIEEQHTALAGHAAIQMAVEIMIEAGLRRSEVLWLTKDSLANDLSFISVVTDYDEDEDEEESLKTGERAVTILPPLRAALQQYLPTLKSQWLIPTPDCRRWSKDGFSRRLRTINKQHGLRWTCNHYRHTYATQRAAEGWPLFRIAREMGNSVAIVEEFYAAFIRPHESTLAAA